MARYFNDKVRCYEDGRVERLWSGHHGIHGWQEVLNTANNKDGYNFILINRKPIFRHRLIASCFLELDINDLTIEVDHINRERLDNSLENLRLVSRQQQCFNKGAKGCSFHKRDKKWYAQICVNQKQTHLGSFKTEQEAHQAYLDAKVLYHII